MNLLNEGKLEVQTGSGYGAGIAKGGNHGVFLFTNAVKTVQSQYQHQCHSQYNENRFF
ncbi:hypothetical protein EVA_16426 [gut metagenome]|uniref:Uncharacterized protein n=1 Tax=gut metagenome TaxID=749906 RepID=J9G0Y1_9ZZZZ